MKGKKIVNLGFTLAEVLVVMAIIGILTAAVFLNFGQGKHTSALRKVGIGLQQDIRLAQNYTLSGSSITFCSSESTSNQFASCNDDGDCGGTAGQYDYCRNGVPTGGWGFSLSSTEEYSIFGDKNNTHTFDSVIEDYEVKKINLTLDSIHISEFKLGSSDPVTPSASDELDVTFQPPDGTIDFYYNGSPATDSASGELINNLYLLVKSDYISASCRKVEINRVSGLVSESQSSCNL